MRCPRCKSDRSRVVDSRTSADGSAIRRRRECLDCFLRYTTYERVEVTPLRVVKKSGERVRFERDRVLQGMLRACEKLPVSTDQLAEASLRIESRCHEEYDREIQSTIIGSLVMEELRRLNQVAYVRFASVYREFKDVSQFLEELKPILESGEPRQGAELRRAAESLGSVGPKSRDTGSRDTGSRDTETMDTVPGGAEEPEEAP